MGDSRGLRTGVLGFEIGAEVNGEGDAEDGAATIVNCKRVTLIDELSVVSVAGNASKALRLFANMAFGSKFRSRPSFCWFATNLGSGA